MDSFRIGFYPVLDETSLYLFLKLSDIPETLDLKIVVSTLGKLLT